jgi:hypothetical protein
MDNWDNTGPHTGWGTPQGNECGIYHFDEITWFALQDKNYRDNWLRYAYYRVRQLDSNIYLALPVKRNIQLRQKWYPAYYLANNPTSSSLFRPPATISNRPGGDVDRNAVQLCAGYGQEEVIQELLLAGPNVPTKVEMRVVPNPSHQWFDISLTRPGPARRGGYYLINTVGVQAAVGEFQGMKHRIDVSTLPRGVYILRVWDGSGSYMEKVSLH